MSTLQTITSAFSAYRDGLKPDLALEAEAHREIIEEILRLKVEKDVLMLGSAMRACRQMKSLARSVVVTAVQSSCLTTRPEAMAII